MKVTEFDHNNKTLNKLNSDSIFRNHVYNMKRVILYYIKFYEDALLVNDNLSSLVNDELNQWNQGKLINLGKMQEVPKKEKFIRR